MSSKRVIVPFLDLATRTLCLALATATFMHAPDAAAVIISVDTLEDSVTNNGNCSLREAVIAANTNAAVDDCPAGTAVGTDNIWVLLNGTIQVSSQLPLLEKVSILGAGRDVTTISGQGASPVFHVDMPDDAHDVTINNLTIADGKSVDSGAGLLVSVAGTVRVENCRFRNNQSGGYVGGAIATHLLLGVSSSLEIVECEFIDNTADNAVTGYGGAIGVDGVGNAAPTSVDIDRSSFIGNHSRVGGALYLYDVNSTSVDRSRFHGNDGGFGGAVYWDSGDIGTGILTISNSTFTDNRGDRGGAIRVAKGLLASISNCTFSGNVSVLDYGNALYTEKNTTGVFHSSFVDNDSSGRPSDSVLVAGSGASIQMSHSIVWTRGVSTEPSCRALTGGSYDSAGFNIDGGTSCGGHASDHTNVADAGLFDLGDYGDNTSALVLQTFLPRPGGLAIDGGKDGPCTAQFGSTLATDQRGELRPADGDGSGGDEECDIGAVEYQPGVDPIARTLGLATIGDGWIANATGNPLCSTATSPCSYELLDGSEITLTATANTGHVFLGWTGDCAGHGTDPCTLTMAHNRNVAAEFQPAAEPARLQLTKTLDEPGIDATIASAPSGINCGATCSANFEVDDVIVLTAAPLPGTAVSGWSGCDSESGDGLQCTIALAGDSVVGITLSVATPVIFSNGFEDTP